MRFLHAHIYGFGKWLDKKIRLHEHGITCIVGENESGKSTFQAFISFILFGLPPKEREFYRPKTSGTLGGDLFVQLETGETVNIRRIDGQQNADATCILSTGEEKNEQWLKEQLQGMTADLFSSTFQLTTQDLYTIEHVQLDELSEVLLNTSVAGASLVHQVEKKLTKHRDELFKPRASVLAINKQLSLMERLQSQLQEHVHITKEYKELTEKVVSYKKEMRFIQEKLAIAKKNRITWGQVETALPFIQQYERADEYYKTNKPISIHEKDIERLQTLEQEKSETASQASFIQQNINRYTEELNRCSVQPSEIIAEGKTILQERDKWAYYERVIDELDREKEQLSNYIQAKIAPYTQAVSLNDLKTIELPPFIDKKWRTMAREVEDLEVTRQQASKVVKEAYDNIQTIDEQLSNARDSMLTEEEYQKYKDRLHADDQVRNQEMYNQSIINQEQQQKRKTIEDYKLGQKIFAGFSGLTIILVIIAWYSNIPWFYHLAILSAIVGWMQWSFKRKDYMRYQEKIKTVETDVKTLHNNERAYLQEKIHIHNQSMETIAFLNQRKEEFQQLYTQRNRELQQVLQTEEKMNKQIEEELLTYPFLDKIELPYWEEIGYVLRDVQSLRLQEEDVGGHLLEIKHVRNTLEHKVRTFSQHLGADYAHISIPLLFARLEDFIHEDVKNRERMENLSQEQRAAQKHYQQQTKQIEDILTEMEAIYSRAHVKSKEEFERKHERYIEQQEKMQQMNQSREQLVAIFSSTTWDTFVHQDIDSHMVHVEQSTWNEKILSYEKEIEDIRSSLAMSQAALDHLERKDSLSYSEQIHTFEREQEVLQQLAEEWAIYQIAYSTLQQTKQSFMTKHIQSLFEKATEHFSYITNHRYKEIRTDFKKSEITVVDHANISFSPKELSKGTRDQLYIAIRLAMGQHTQENIPFPFIFDDSFVHFDAKRTERMIQLMVRIAQNQQVIICTCKDEIEEVIQFHTEKNEISWVRIQ